MIGSCRKCGQFIGVNGHTCTPKPALPSFQRFISKYAPQRGTKACWIWRGAKDKCGYGKLTVGSRTDHSRHLFSAHRYSYQFHIGPIPKGMSVLHRCDVRACVNPEHLYPGTQRENVLDAVRRGRWKQGFKKQEATV